MLDLNILFPSVLNGITTGAVYALIALGLTLIYGVLHIINFAHGSMLMLSMFGVYYLLTKLGIDPYLSLLVMVPLMFVVVFLAIGLLLKTVTGSVAALVIAVAAITVTLGVAGWLGIYLTPPSAAAPIMILTIVVADCVHILSGMFHEMRQGVARHQALYNSIKHNFKPIFLTSATTALGFLSMYFSDVPPFQDLGNMVAFGVMAAFVLSVTLFPALLALLPVKVSTQADYQGSPLMAGISRFVLAHHRRLLPGSVIVMAALLLFISQNELNDKYVEFFDQSVPFRAATELMEQELSGVDSLEFSIETGIAGGINNPKTIAAIADFSDWLRTQPEVDHVNTITDIFKRLNKNMHGDDPAWYTLPDNEQLAAQYLLLYEMSLPMGLDLNNQVNVDKSASRIIVTLKNLPTYQLLEFEQRASDWFANQYPNLQLNAASISLMFAHVSKKNIDSMLFGSVIALILISPILGLALRSAKYGVLSLLPNLLPAGGAEPPPAARGGAGGAPGTCAFGTVGARRPGQAAAAPDAQPPLHNFPTRRSSVVVAIVVVVVGRRRRHRRPSP